ncbi:thiamine-phosphate kinase [Brevibacterium ammoniilyticum]|uniref:Thiamine-monophosphate kinase n=1 Tax=Brevibacterium ammoniilyticum TaxID=1046555 RepID=A0ABP9U5P9_9MICO
MTRLSELGESAVLRRLLAHRRAGSHEVVGPGDDAAVTKITGDLVSTADMLVEGEDFTRDWLDWSRLGVKAAAQNLADVCAMGAAPHGLLVSLAVPDSTEAGDLEALFSGIVTEAERAGRELGCTVPIIGGDLSSSGLIVTAITALGTVSAEEGAITRSGARPGDEIWLAGTLGRAAGGLDLLFAGARPGDDLPEGLASLIATQLAPQPDYAAMAHRPAASAMIDVSDGLSTDLGRIADASGVHAEIDRTALDDLVAPLRPAARYVLAARAADGAGGDDAGAGGAVSDDAVEALALHWVLDGGEDHGFVASSPVSAADPVGWRRIGEMQAGSGVGLDGAPVPTSGFSHFGK